MLKTKPIFLTCALTVFAMVIVGFLVVPRPGSIRYHRDRLGHLRSSSYNGEPSAFTDYFRYKTWLWYLHGKRSTKIEEMEEHQQALIRLGYFERREFKLTQRTLDAQVWGQFRSTVSNTVFTDSRWMVHLDDHLPTSMRITAHKTDMPRFDSIISEIDTVGAQGAAGENRTITIEYVAHACFRVTSPSGKQVLIDPYASRVWLGYDFPPNIHADAVLISHPHYHHDGGEAMRRSVPWTLKTPLLRQPGTNQIGDIRVIGYAGKHADPWGKEFGQSNTVWLVQVAGLRIVHLGDNGPLRDETIREIGRVDVLMIPIDSQFHILKADQIAAIRRQVSPPILIPMHYRHDDLETSPDKPEQLGGIEEWAKGEANVRYLASHKQELSVATIPKKTEVVIFKHSPLVKVPLKSKGPEQ